MKSTLPVPVDYQVFALVGRKILVVEDDEAMLTAVSKVLRLAGATVFSACDVAQAIQLMSEKGVAFDAVLTDLRMPGASGKAILSIIRTAYPDVPVMIMSAYWTEKMKDECALLGTTFFLEKPLHSSQLLDALARAVLRAPRAARVW